MSEAIGDDRAGWPQRPRPLLFERHTGTARFSFAVALGGFIALTSFDGLPAPLGPGAATIAIVSLGARLAASLFMHNACALVAPCQPGASASSVWLRTSDSGH